MLTTKDIWKQVLVAVVRWALAFFGAKLVEKGILDEVLADAWLSSAAMILAGAVIFALALLWKYLNAKFNWLALVQAVQTDPPADTPKEINAAVAGVKKEVKADNTVASL